MPTVLDWHPHRSLTYAANFPAKATGHIGTHITRALLSTNRFTITALTRASSTSASDLPPGITPIQIDYTTADPAAPTDSLVRALQGHHFLIITTPGFAPPEVHSTLAKAAATAGVPYVMPNGYGTDFSNEALRGEDMVGEAVLKRCKEIERVGKGKTAWIALVCGFWYEHSLALGDWWFGFDIGKRRATLFDEGTTRINSSTMASVGRAVAGLLSLPERSEGGGGTCLEGWRNKPLYVSSFLVNQREMLGSLLRVTGAKEGEWDVRCEGSRERWEDGKRRVREGEMVGIAKAMYSRNFFPGGGGDFESVKGVSNGVLGIGRESLDEATGRAVEMGKDGFNPYA